MCWRNETEAAQSTPSRNSSAHLDYGKLKERGIRLATIDSAEMRANVSLYDARLGFDRCRACGGRPSLALLLHGAAGTIRPVLTSQAQSRTWRFPVAKSITKDAIKVGVDVGRGIMVSAKGHPAQIVAVAAAAGVAVVATAVGYAAVTGMQSLVRSIQRRK